MVDISETKWERDLAAGSYGITFIAGTYYLGEVTFWQPYFPQRGVNLTRVDLDIATDDCSATGGL